MVPAPTAWTEADAPPLKIRITTSIVIEFDTAANADQSMKRANEVRYTVRRPDASEKADHHRGKIAMLSINKATLRLVTVGVVFKSAST